MSKSYVIQWKSKINGRAGRGNKIFTREQAERLAAELNREYPEIVHEPVPAEPAAPSALAGDEARSGDDAGENEADTTHASFSSH